MDVNKLFEDRIKELGDWRGEKLIELRRIVENVAPDAQLTWKWGSPVWTQNGLLLSLGSFSDHVKIHFFKGTSIRNSGNLFNSGIEAKLTRGINIFKNDAIDEKSLITLIKTAVELNTKS